VQVSLSYMSQAHATAALHTLPEHPASMHDDVRHPASVQAYAHRTGVSMPASSSGSSSSMEVLLTAVLQQNVKLEQIAQKVSALAGGGGSGGSSGGSSSSAASKDSATAVAPLAPVRTCG
jgi:lambda repressor-like predicted transcriptional regulator